MKHTEKFLRQRKFIVVLPLLATPFITMIFWALGGGQSVPAQAAADPLAGINLRLPEAYFDESEKMDKLSLYEKASEDSVKFEDASETESYFNVDLIQDGQSEDTTKDPLKVIRTHGLQTNAIDPNEKKVNEKLAALYKALNAPVAPPPTYVSKVQVRTPVADSSFEKQVGKLEEMMNVMQQESAEDPEMKQMNTMLDKILEIQHPERAIPAPTDSNATLSVEPLQPAPEISQLSHGVMPAVQEISTDSVMPTSEPAEEAIDGFRINRFYGDEDDIPSSEMRGNAIQAVIHSNQEVVAGSTVKLRIATSVDVEGHTIPEGQFIYGTCSLNDERLSITITSVRLGNALLPVSLQVYDLDGLPGIYIPGAIARDAAKQASGQSVQGLQLMSMDNSLSTQAASAGIESAKSLLTKKAKLIKVTLKAGYQVLLKDKDSKTTMQPTRPQ